MLTIENLLERLDEINWEPPELNGQRFEINNNWDRRFISDVCYHIRNSKPISTAQGELALKLIGRYRGHLEASGLDALELNTALATPQYRTAPYQSSQVPREVRYAGQNLLLFRCKFNPIIIEDIKKLKGDNWFIDETYPAFNREHKLWIVRVNQRNLDKVMDVIRRHHFNADDVVVEYLTNSVNARAEQSEITVDDEHIVVTCRNDDFFDRWVTLMESREKHV